MRIRLALLALIIILLAAGCGVENISGVDLATVGAEATVGVEPTATTDESAATDAAPPATTTPDPATLVELPNLAEKEFLGTILTLEYPDGWDTQEGGQSLNIFLPAEDGGFGLTAFVSLTRSVNIDRNEERVAQLVMAAFLQNAAQGGFLPEESAPTVDSSYAFEWGPLAAAIFPWRSDDDGITGVNLVVMDDNRDRFITIFAQSSLATWPDYEPIWLAMLGSFTLDGEVLPLADVRAAYDAAQTGQ